LALVLFEQRFALAAIMILAFGDPLAHLISTGFGGTDAIVTERSYIYGTIGGALVGAFAAWAFVPFLPGLLASAAAMVVEAGEVRIADHHLDDNLTIPLVAGAVLWVISLAFSI
jgi:dolichol kinase